MAFIIILKICCFRIIIKNLTKFNVLNIFAFKKFGKFTDHNLEKLRPCWSLALTIAILGLKIVSSKSWFLVLDFFESLASNVVSSTPPPSFSVEKFYWLRFNSI